MEFLVPIRHVLCLTTALVFFLGLWSCNSDEPEPPEEQNDPCENQEMSVIGPAELTAFYQGSVSPIPQEGVLEGIVISSDRHGNIFGSLYIQDKAVDPGFGFEIRTDLLDIYTRFPMGASVRISLEGLYLGKSGDGWALGTFRELFGNPVLDRIPALETLERISLACEADGTPPSPRTVTLDSVSASHMHTLVRLSGVEVSGDYPGDRFAEPETETLVPLEDCAGKGVTLENSGYSDFQALTLPRGSGTATGILKGSPSDLRLLLRSALDLAFDDPNCDALFPPVRSDQVLISELADPDNASGARFLELYNAGKEPVDLKGWRLLRYTNANEEPGSMAELDGLRIPSGGTLVFSANPEVFEEFYGQPPDVVLRSNGPADSNGDDNILLMNPFDEIADAFGIPGEDGSGTAHEFEDGRALRRSVVTKGSSEFRPEQWIITNDSGGEGTLQNPGNAPGDYSPGNHPDPGVSS